MSMYRWTYKLFYDHSLSIVSVLSSSLLTCNVLDLLVYMMFTAMNRLDTTTNFLIASIFLEINFLLIHDPNYLFL